MTLAALCITAAAALSVPKTAPSPATVLITTVPAQGIDISALQHPHNAAINWPDVAAAGNTFAAVKASEGAYYANPYYASDAAQAASAGLLVMPYALANPYPAKANGSAKDQADMAARQLTPATVPARQMLPLALDIEPDPYAAAHNTTQCYGLSPAAMTRWIRQFLTEAQLKTGMKPLIYTTAAWWKACTANSPAFGGYPLWIAWYGKTAPALPAGWNKYTFWQHTTTGAIPGITGTPADQDYLGPIPHASPAAKPVTLTQYPPAPPGLPYWIAAALLAASITIAATTGLAIGSNGNNPRRARTDHTAHHPALRPAATAKSPGVARVGALP